ncbi:MAG: DUF6390 family protein [Candidatus Limnocylindria bacterium]
MASWRPPADLADGGSRAACEGGASAPGRRRPVSGPILFARYAYGPNRLGLCGPDDAEALFGEGAQGTDERELRALALGFEGAYPYLQLIAGANGIADPLDRRVVESYWLGGPLLDAVTPDLLGESLRRRFRARLSGPAWGWMRSAAPAGAKPVHAFHVLDVFPKVGFLRAEQAAAVVTAMDSCRIRWGRVRERIGDGLLVDVVPLVMDEGKLAFGAPRPEHVTGWRDGRGFLGDVASGDVVSIHWGWACDVLGEDQARRLIAWTRRELEIANQTL